MEGSWCSRLTIPTNLSIIPRASPRACARKHSPVVKSAWLIMPTACGILCSMRSTPGTVWFVLAVLRHNMSSTIVDWNASQLSHRRLVRRQSRITSGRRTRRTSYNLSVIKQMERTLEALKVGHAKLSLTPKTANVAQAHLIKR